MGCTLLTRGRVLNCNRISGGIRAVYFAVLDQVSELGYNTAVAPNEVRELTKIAVGDNSIYRYLLPVGSSNFVDTIVGSRQNGTVYYTPVVNIVYNRLSKEDQAELKLLASTKTIVFCELNQELANGHYVIVAMGMVNGMELNSGTVDSGTAWGDRNGYSLTLDGQEVEPFAMVTDYTDEPFDNVNTGAAPITVVKTGL
tara:strand:+ start:193 stop:789 length:597 start_codon:yes stop_codon:yes gene_type:complete